MIAGPLEVGPNSNPNLIWRVLLDGRLLVNMSTNQLLMEGDALLSELEINSAERNNETLEFTLRRKANSSGDGVYNNKTLHRSNGQHNRSRYYPQITPQ